MVLGLEVQAMRLNCQGLYLRLWAHLTRGGLWKGPTPLSPPPLALGTPLHQQQHEITDSCNTWNHRGQASCMLLPLNKACKLDLDPAVYSLNSNL